MSADFRKGDEVRGSILTLLYAYGYKLDHKGEDNLSALLLTARNCLGVIPTSDLNVLVK